MRENVVREMAARFAGRRFDKGSDGFADLSRPGDIVHVLNNTGSDLDRYSVVGLDTTMFLPSESETAFTELPRFVGVVPTWEYRGRFGVLIEPVVDGGVARACVHGVCIAVVSVAALEHCWCDIDDGSTAALTSGGEGGAQILWREGEEPYGYGYGSFDEGYGYTGSQYAIIRIGPMSTERWAKLPSGGISAGASGTVEFFSDGRFSDLTGETADCHNEWDDDANPTSRKCRVKRSGTRWTLDFWGCS